MFNKTLELENFNDFSYRNTPFKNNKWIITKGYFKFEKDLTNNILYVASGDENKYLYSNSALIKDFNYNQKFIIKGDANSASIAAASILAKVSRDRYMDKIAQEFPMYDWESNKGYLTKKHIQAIQEFGTTKYHRMSFLKNIIKSL